MKFLHLKKVDSTNEYLKTFLKEQPTDWLVVSAENQTAGKGYYGNQWKTNPSENLTFSFSFLNTPFSAFELQRWVAVVLHQFFNDELGESLKIKWPNDLMFGKNKLSGVLIEKIQIPNGFAHIIGIGINVNQTDFQENLRATSLQHITQREYQLNQLLDDLMRFIFTSYPLLKIKETEIYYHQHLFQKDLVRSYEANGQRFNGIVRGVDENGLLLVEIEDESIRKYKMKEISYLA